MQQATNTTFYGDEKLKRKKKSFALTCKYFVLELYTDAS